MAPTPQELEQIYTEKAQLARGREAALTRLAYAAAMLDIYSEIPEDSPNSASAHLRKARSSLIYLDQVRQDSSFAEAANDPHYLAINSREQASQLAALAQTNIAIVKATGFGHADIVTTLVGLKSSFEEYSTRVGELCARERDEAPPNASLTARPAMSHVRPGPKN